MATELKNETEGGEISIKGIVISLRYWVLYLLPNWCLFCIAGLLGGAAGLGYSWFKQPTYTATTTFVLDGVNKGGLSQYIGMAAMVGIDLGAGAGGLFQGDNILELYKSRSMLAKTLLSKLDSDSSKLLIDLYIDYNDIKENWKDRPELLALNFGKDPSTLPAGELRLRDSIITAFTNTINRNLLKVEKLDKQLSIISVEITSPNEQFSKAFNDNLVKCVNEFYIQTKTKRSTKNIAILEAKADSVRALMEGAIYSAARISDETPNLNPTRQIQRVAPSQKAQFSAETNKAILAQIIQNLELSKMSLLQEEPLIQLVDQPTYPLKVNRLGSVKGLVVGAFLFGFFMLLYLVGRKWYSDAFLDGD